jgi:hypothetical protein
MPGRDIRSIFQLAREPLTSWVMERDSVKDDASPA